MASPLSTAGLIQEAAALPKLPTFAAGIGEHGQTQFCEIDGAAKISLLSWLAEHHPCFQPTIVRLSKAKKELCSILQRSCSEETVRCPTIESQAPVSIHSPLQEQYPVWYFFYGTLADPGVLSQHLALEEAPHYIPASVTGGRLRTWAGKHKALVDAPGEVVFGTAFLAKSREQEDALRFYETDMYEVVRCQITIQSEMLDGLTFRFDGLERELD